MYVGVLLFGKLSEHSWSYLLPVQYSSIKNFAQTIIRGTIPAVTIKILLTPYATEFLIELSYIVVITGPPRLYRSLVIYISTHMNYQRSLSKISLCQLATSATETCWYKL